MKGDVQLAAPAGCCCKPQSVRLAAPHRRCLRVYMTLFNITLITTCHGLTYHSSNFNKVIIDMSLALPAKLLVAFVLLAPLASSIRLQAENGMSIEAVAVVGEEVNDGGEVEEAHSCKSGDMEADHRTWMFWDSWACLCRNGRFERCQETPKYPDGCRNAEFPPRDKCTFVCPEKSCAKSTRSCIDEISDCECMEGYIMADGVCKPVCEEGEALYGDTCKEIGYCPKTQQDVVPGCDYVCPENSCADPGQGCVSSFGDCDCQEGFERNNKAGVCLKMEEEMPMKGCDFDEYTLPHMAWKDSFCMCYNGSFYCAVEAEDLEDLLSGSYEP